MHSEMENSIEKSAAHDKRAMLSRISGTKSVAHLDSPTLRRACDSSIRLRLVLSPIASARHFDPHGPRRPRAPSTTHLPRLHAMLACRTCSLSPYCTSTVVALHLRPLERYPSGVLRRTTTPLSLMSIYTK